jgi:hypothetical protein
MRAAKILLIGCIATVSLFLLGNAFYVEQKVYEGGSLEPIGTQTVGVMSRHGTVMHYVTRSANEKLQQAKNVQLLILVPLFIGFIIIDRRKSR